MSAMYAQRQSLGSNHGAPVAGPSTSKPSNVGAVGFPPSSANNRRDSVASSCYSYGSYSSSGSSSGSSTAGYDSDETIDEDDEIATPPFLPADSVIATAATAPNNSKGKGKATAHDGTYLDFAGSFAAFSLTDDEHDHAGAAAVPLSPPSPTRPLPPAAAVAPSPAAAPRTAFQSSKPKPEPSDEDLAPKISPQHAAHVRPPPQPSPPTRAVEEAHRGRSRWPRLLWRSDLDMDSLVVLKNYHERAVGQPLPVLRAGMAPKEVETWSRRMEYAGL
ncbi:hypothetical protein JCM10908_001017 [Rhodotorula pacifica]|uniref:uncharacterized protein n=1 Tax=Rhodotorula pacifica TaxID=1495444 RepID=UPI003181F074